MRNLNEKEQAVLNCIRSLCKRNGYSPSVRDICGAMGYKSTSTVQMYLDRLAEYGYIRRAEGKSRSILLCEPFFYKKIRCLRRGLLPSGELDEADFEGELPFVYAGDVSEGVDLIAVICDGEWWVIAAGEQLPTDQPRVCIQNGKIAVCSAADGSACLGVLLAKIGLC